MIFSYGKKSRQPLKFSGDFDFYKHAMPTAWVETIGLAFYSYFLTAHTYSANRGAYLHINQMDIKNQHAIGWYAAAWAAAVSQF
jgi:hypothetical protein